MNYILERHDQIWRSTVWVILIRSYKRAPLYCVQRESSTSRAEQIEAQNHPLTHINKYTFFHIFGFVIPRSLPFSIDQFLANSIKITQTWCAQYLWKWRVGIMNHYYPTCVKPVDFVISSLLERPWGSAMINNHDRPVRLVSDHI